MSRVIREELQDRDGNIHYLHTEDCIVFGEDGRSLREIMGNVQFEDYTAEGTEIPDAETALEGITKGKKWTELFSNIKAFCKGVVLLSRVVDSENITEDGYLMSGKKCSEMFQEVSVNLNKVRIYVGSDGKILFVNSTGADSVLPFKRDFQVTVTASSSLYQKNDPTLHWASAITKGIYKFQNGVGTFTVTSRTTANAYPTGNASSSTTSWHASAPIITFSEFKFL